MVDIVFGLKFSGETNKNTGSEEDVVLHSKFLDFFGSCSCEEGAKWSNNNEMCTL